MAIVSTDTLVYSAIALAPLLLAWVFRKRLLAVLGKMVIAEAERHLLDTMFDVEEVDSPEGKKRVLRPSKRLQALLASTLPAVIEVGLQSVKIKLPKFAPINPSTGALDFTAGIAAKMADGKKVNIEEIAKALFMQVGMPFIEAKVGPMLQGVMSGVGQAVQAPEKKEKEAENPFLKELNL